MITRSEIPINIIREALIYDPHTGILTWLVRPLSHFSTVRACSITNAKFAGRAAGGEVPDTRGHLQISVNNRSYAAHRIAWFLHTGDWPLDTIDHINGIKTDNRIENLRDVSHLVNMRNLKHFVSNTSGVMGVSWHVGHEKWAARINRNGKLSHLGYFDSFEDAVNARKVAEIDLGYHPNHGRKVA